MPTIYRPMKHAEDGLPVVGSNSKELGVRIPPNSNADIDLDGNGSVILNGKGMSVAKHWKYLLGHLVPKRLRPTFPGATGPNSLTCYKTGTGAFAEASLNHELTVALKTDDPHAGNVVPSRLVALQQFQAALAATRAQWTPDET
jgi:hypothetical protein